MRIRHITARDNVDAEGRLINPRAVRHGVIVAGRVAELSGPVDPSTHLNADFEEHGLEQCAIAEKLAVGAAVLVGEDGFLLAEAADDAYQPLGEVNVPARLAAWRHALSRRRGAP